MMMKLKHISLILLASALLSSCTKEEREKMYADQEKKIESFVDTQKKSHPDVRVEYNNGSTRVVVTEGSGLELNARGKASILFAGYDFTSGNLSAQTMFATNNYEFAMSNKWNLTDESVFEAIEIDMKDKDIIEGLISGLEGVREGEECYILFTGKYAFGKNELGTIPANAPLAYRIWVQTIEN